MPFGISWTRYIALITTSLLSGVAGSQLVHIMYEPLADFEKLVEDQMEQLKDRQIPPESLEEMLDRYEVFHTQLEEFEKEWGNKHK